ATDGDVRESVVDAADLGLPRAHATDLRGGDPAFNAEVVRQLLSGRRGPVRDAVLANAAAALAAQDGDGGDLRKRLRVGLERAAGSRASGAAAAALGRWRRVATAQA